MTTAYGFDFARPRSRGARIARIDALATLLDTAFVIPGTGIRFGLDGLIGLFPVIGDTITNNDDTGCLRRPMFGGIRQAASTADGRSGQYEFGRKRCASGELGRVFTGRL
jgi:Domain of unknown function (DUF4112)